MNLSKLIRDGYHGRDWYSDAHASIVQWSNSNGQCPTRTADILSITSPRVTVRHNVTLAIGYLLNGQLPTGVIPSTTQALAHYEETGKIRGPKTSAFALALQGVPSAVVLDVWMAKALDIEQSKLRKARYRKEAQRIKRAAYRARLTPAQAQAAIWTALRMLHGHAPAPMILS